MNFRTSYLMGLMAVASVVFLVPSYIESAVAAEPLKITGPDGQTKQSVRQYGPTTRSDTFWSISQKMRPDASVSVYQVMAAIYDANPHAFSSPNYNSLERGMILLIPSKEVMQAIPISLAKEMAERSDKGLKTAPINTKPAAVDTAPSSGLKTAEAPPKVVEAKSAPVDNAKVTELQAKIDILESGNMSLTDELGRAKDELGIANSDNIALKDKITELNNRIAVLEESLQASREQQARLKAENESLVQETVEPPMSSQEPDDTWRNLMDNPLLLAAGAVIPALLLLVLVWLFIGRKRNKNNAMAQGVGQQNVNAMAVAGAAGGAATVVAAEDDVDFMAVHLDDNDSSLDSLLDVEHSGLQPEVSLAEEVVLTDHDMFVDSGTHEELSLDDDEGQSLDDLWAEAMGEQDEVEDAAENDLDSLLDGLDLDMPATEPDSDEEDLDALLAGFNENDGKAALDDASTQDDTLIRDSSANDLGGGLSEDLDDELDIEALLSENTTDADPEHSASDSESSFKVETEDLDVLLGAGTGFAQDDAEADTEAVDFVNEISDSSAVEDDLDALLAGLADDVPLGESAEAQAPKPDVTLAEAIAAELDDADVSVDDDLDALLADFDAVPETAQPQVAEDLSEEIAAELESELSLDSEEDIDTLLADLEKPVVGKADDLSDEIAAELQDEITLDSEDDLDALMAEFDIETTSSESDTASEKVDIEKNVTEDNELDSLLAGFNTDSAEVINEPKVDAKLDSMDPVGVSSKESGFFNDLKASKAASNMLEWDADEASADVSDDDLLAVFANKSDVNDEDDFSAEDAFMLDDEDNLTVEQALAALDAKESNRSKSKVDEEDLTNFQKENGFIDIDRLLNEADEDTLDTDPYRDFDVDMDMGDVGSLLGNTSMIDVDDEENSVNAKLDLARAYIEIDDKDSARALLKEVELDGNSRQQDEAASLLKEID